MEPMFREATSGWNVTAGSMRSATGMVGPPPVVMFTTALVLCLMRGRNCP